MNDTIEQNTEFTNSMETKISNIEPVIGEILDQTTLIKTIESDRDQTNLTESGPNLIESGPNKIKTDPVESSTDLANPKFMYKNLVLSSGSVKGIAHIGAVQKLIDEKLLDLEKLNAVAGTSSGALLGLLIVLGFSIDEIWSFTQSVDFRKLVSPNIILFLTKCGVETGQIIYNIIEEVLIKKTGIKHINFRQLYEITKINYTIVGSCLTTKEAIYYNHKNTPNFKVSVAVRISIGIPGFFTPVVVDDKKYVDGGVIDEYPIDLFADEIDQTIGILICNNYDTDYEYPEQFFTAIVNLFLYVCYKNNYSKYKNNTIYVNKNMSKISVFDFDLDIETKNKIYQSGIAAVEDFLAGSNNSCTKNIKV